MCAKPVAPLVLAGEEALIARIDDLRYAMYRPEGPDDFGVVHHKLIYNFTPQEVEGLLQLLGAYIEKCASLEGALQKTGG